MEWFDKILNNPLAQGVLNNALGSPAAAPPASAPVIHVQNPVAEQGMSTNMMLAIGAGVLAVVGLLVFSLRGK